MSKRFSKALIAIVGLSAIILASCGFPMLSGAVADGSASRAAASKTVSLNVVVEGELDDAKLATLAAYGRIVDTIPELGAVFMSGKGLSPEALLALPFVVAANPDAERGTGPVSTLSAADMADGMSTWNLDAVDVTEPGFGRRVVAETGAGVYVAVLDTGLVYGWERYFPAERIAVEYAKSFGGGAVEVATVSEQPNKWEHDQNSHGTHVTSTILGYFLNATAINGVAPLATVIPVKVLNQNGSGRSSAIAQGIVYVANLKKGPLAAHPVVINMSLGGGILDAVEKAAIDYAVEAGVVIVASAGNSGMRGMGYPGAYEPVISVAASGWVGEWYKGLSTWWYSIDVSEPTNPGHFYITDFSSRAIRPEHDLDMAAPGSQIVGPYQVNGQAGWYFLGGTSMASPHVAGIVALMLEKDPALVAGQVEDILEATAIPLAPGSRNVYLPGGTVATYSWGADATGHGLVNTTGALALVAPPVVY